MLNTIPALAAYSTESVSPSLFIAKERGVRAALAELVNKRYNVLRTNIFKSVSMLNKSES